MNTIWLEDFLVLAECLNFSRAAERRNVTQPAFGRRIRALEEWAGQALIDRSSHRLELTDAGRAVIAAAGDVRSRLRSLRRELDIVEASETGLIFASTQSLSFTFFPEWFRRMPTDISGASVRLLADNMQGCEQIMEAGQAQFLLCHEHPAAPALLDGRNFQAIPVAVDRLFPVVSRESALSMDDGTIPLLAYDERSGLGRIMNAVLHDRLAGLSMQHVFTSHLTMALKTMAIEGRGVAWIPESIARDELRPGGALRLAGGEEWTIDVDIVLVRPRHRQSPLAERFWSEVLDMRNGP